MLHTAIVSSASGRPKGDPVACAVRYCRPAEQISHVSLLVSSTNASSSQGRERRQWGSIRGRRCEGVAVLAIVMRSLAAMVSVGRST